LRIVAWNIENGGKKRTSAIVCTLAELSPQPDVIVLTEYGINASAGITSELATKAWGYHLHSSPPQNNDGVSAHSRWPMDLITNEPSSPSEALRHRFLQVHVGGLCLLGAYIPARGDRCVDSTAAWLTLTGLASGLILRPSVILGDLNSGIHGDDWRPIRGRKRLEARGFRDLGVAGWHDAWRGLHAGCEEYSFYPRTDAGDHDGFRLDHALLSPKLVPRVKAAEYLHAARRAGLSKHAPLILDLIDG
jgi:exodeoxyribonuclease-3